MKLLLGQWVYWSIDRPMPALLKVYEGRWSARKHVGEITRYQAMAYFRHSQQTGIWHSLKTSNERWIDVRMAGDIDAALADGDTPR